MKKVVKFQKNN